MTRNNSKIILALDFDDRTDVERLVSLLKDDVVAFKVGKQLFTTYGPEIVTWIQAQGAKVFLDLKFHDIPNTVAKASGAATDLGVFIFNVHCSGGREMMIAAKEESRVRSQNLLGLRPFVLGVTVLTSMSETSLKKDLNCEMSLKDQVLHLALLAQGSALDGVVASSEEITLIREACGPDFLIVTPGVRPTWATKDDQERVMTPQEAIDLGADYIVIGRPVMQADDPKDALSRLWE